MNRFRSCCISLTLKCHHLPSMAVQSRLDTETACHLGLIQISSGNSETGAALVDVELNRAHLDAELVADIIFQNFSASG